MAGINLSPSKSYLTHHKNGKLNLAGTIRNVVNALPDGETFSASSMANFLANCGAGSEIFKYQGKVNSSLSNFATNYGSLKRDLTSYYRVTHGRTHDQKRNSVNLSTTSKTDERDQGLTEIQKINMDLFGYY